ncbi:MAG: PQQ-binding-like beta-propeller repeat protein, partial [Prosthecobacter sp.]|nr:PQQ-binding-like beta-propeller repeat protein [Prosthecobacter sp.]
MDLPRRLLFLLACGLATVHAADWPQFLGPQRDGIADAAEPALPDTLPADLKPLWQVAAGSGFAGPVVAAGKLILFHREGGDMVTQAFDARTGKEVWRASYVTDYVDSFGFDNGPRAVPSIQGGKVFTHGPEGRVTAYDFASGKELWVFDTASAVNSQQGFFGRAPSPLVVGDRVIIAAGGSKDGQPAGLIALETATGKLAWNAVEDEAGYASPVALPGEPTILSWMRNKLWLVDSKAGVVLASVPLRARMDASVNAATPVHCGDGRWFVTAGYGVGANLFRKSETGMPLERLWQKQDLMDCHYSTPVFLNSHLYGFNGRQESGQTLRCIDLETGKVNWDSP